MIDTINLAYLLYYELFEYWQFAITLTVDIPDLTQFTFRDVPRYIYMLLLISIVFGRFVAMPWLPGSTNLSGFRLNIILFNHDRYFLNSNNICTKF